MRAIRIKTLVSQYGLPKSTVYYLIKAAGFPRPIKLSERVAVWDESAVNEWIQNRASHRSALAQEAA